MPDTSDEPTPPQLIDDALKRVLASRYFRSSARKRRFLQFIVQETQAGRADRIKAYTIAMDVFDRDASFDPLLDPAVRIQAGRIRRCLEQYYLTEGTSDPIQIVIPKGSYVPCFVMKQEAAIADPPEDPENGGQPYPAKGGDDHPVKVLVEAPVSILPPSPPSRSRTFGTTMHRTAIFTTTVLVAMSALLLIAVWSAAFVPQSRTEGERTAAVPGPSLMVLPFATGADKSVQDIFAEGFTEDLIGALIRFKNLLVFGADTNFRYRSEPAPHNAEPNITIDYLLKGSVNRIGNQIQISAALLHAKDGRYIWTDSFRRDFNPTNMIDLRRDIAAEVARALAQSHGVIYTEEVRNSTMRSPEKLSSYECMLRTRQYWRQLSADLHGQVRTCLERAVQTDPLYADAWAALAMVYIDEVRLRFNPTSARPDPVAAGLQLATHAVALAPDNPLPFQALGLARWLHREPYLGIAAYEQAYALNPHDSDILADLGRCYSLVGDWEKGIPLLQEAFKRNPAQPSWYHMVTALFHYVHGRYDEALVEAKRIDLPDAVLPHVALAMIHGQAGHKADAAREVEDILRLDPAFSEKAVSELERRNIDAAIIAKIVNGLVKAGLPIPPQPASGREER